jgi:hypothetical protein
MSWCLPSLVDEPSQSLTREHSHTQLAVSKADTQTLENTLNKAKGTVSPRKK